MSTGLEAIDHLIPTLWHEACDKCGTRMDLKLFSSSGDQQEQPFVQVNDDLACGSSSSDWQRLAPAGEKC
jgi:hypothetical protein